MTWRRLLLLDGALLGLAILASRAALLLHEVAGHGVTALLLGARGFTLKLSLFGGGFVNTSGLRTGDAGYAFFSLGGIAVNLLTGAAAWLVAIRLRRRGLLYAFLLMFGSGSVGQAIFYLGNGFFFGEGDPQGFVGPQGDLLPYQWMWVLFVLPFAGVAAMAARGWLSFLSGHAPVDSPPRRLGWTALTVGVVTGAYFALWFATWDSTVDITMRQHRVQTEIAKEMQRRPPPPPPPPSPPAQPMPPPPPPVVTEADVAPRVPPPVAAIAMLVSGLLAAAIVLWRAKPPPPEPVPLTPLAAGLPVALAAAAIGVIVLFGR